MAKDFENLGGPSNPYRVSNGIGSELGGANYARIENDASGVKFSKFAIGQTTAAADAKIELGEIYQLSTAAKGLASALNNYLKKIPHPELQKFHDLIKGETASRAMFDRAAKTVIASGIDFAASEEGKILKNAAEKYTALSTKAQSLQK